MSEDFDFSSYVPSDNEDFMNAKQKAYFRAKLTTWRNDILKEARETLDHLAEESANQPDVADRASSETDRAIELRARDRQRKLIGKIDAALSRIDDGTYGYWRADQLEAARRTAHRDIVDRGSGTARAAREGLSRRIGFA